MKNQTYFQLILSLLLGGCASEVASKTAYEERDHSPSLSPDFSIIDKNLTNYHRRKTD